MNHSDEWQRWEPNGNTTRAANPWACFEDQDPTKELQKREAAQGHWRGEFKVSTARIVQVFKKLFGKEKS